MKILLINERLDFAGGAERYTVDIASGLTDLGHDVAVVYGLPPQPNFQFSARLPARQVFNFKSMMIEGLNVDGVKKEVARFNPDVINVQNIDDPKLLLALNRLKPTVRFIHDHRSYCPGNSKLWFGSNQVCPIAMGWTCAAYAFKEKCMTRRLPKMLRRISRRREMLKALRQLPLVLCNSNYVRERLIQNGLDEKKVVINSLFPGGLPSELSSPAKVGWGEPPAVIFVGRIFLEKGVDYLLKAVALIKEVPFKVSIIGEGWDLNRCRELAHDLNIDDRVEFTGYLPREEIDSFYRRCRLLVFPSVWPEPFGMVGLEAYSFGKPVVAFEVGGVRDWLVDKQTGYLVERGNIPALAEKIKLLLTNITLARSLGEGGRKLVEEKFSQERHFRQLVDIYRSLTVPTLSATINN